MAIRPTMAANSRTGFHELLTYRSLRNPRRISGRLLSRVPLVPCGIGAHRTYRRQRRPLYYRFNPA